MTWSACKDISDLPRQLTYEPFETRAKDVDRMTISALDHSWEACKTCTAETMVTDCAMLADSEVVCILTAACQNKCRVSTLQQMNLQAGNNSLLLPACSCSIANQSFDWALFHLKRACWWALRITLSLLSDWAKTFSQYAPFQHTVFVRVWRCLALEEDLTVTCWHSLKACIQSMYTVSSQST